MRPRAMKPCRKHAPHFLSGSGGILEWKCLGSYKTDDLAHPQSAEQIGHIGEGEVNLDGWTLVSTKGDQTFPFERDVVLAPGRSVVVMSGPNAVDQLPAFIRWTDRHVWSNSGDPGELGDSSGTIRAESR